MVSRHRTKPGVAPAGPVLSALVLLAAFSLAAPGEVETQAPAPRPARTVKGLMQVRPGGPLEEAEVGVHEVPVDLPTVSAAQAPLQDDELVLGVVVGDRAVAYPIRYLALFEVVDHRLGDTPLAPTW